MKGNASERKQVENMKANIKLTNSVIVLGITNNPKWELSPNLDCWEAFISTRVEFDSEEDAEDFTSIPANSVVDRVDFCRFFEDGTARLKINA